MTLRIVRDIMTTHLVTVGSDDTLSHATNLFRQHQFHHLPIVQSISPVHTQWTASPDQQPALIFQGLLTTEDIEMAIALAKSEVASEPLPHPWQDRHVAEIMHRMNVWVTPTTSVAAAAQLLAEHGINCLQTWIERWQPIWQAMSEWEENQQEIMGKERSPERFPTTFLDRQEDIPAQPRRDSIYRQNRETARLVRHLLVP